MIKNPQKYFIEPEEKLKLSDKAERQAYYRLF